MPYATIRVRLPAIGRTVVVTFLCLAGLAVLLPGPAGIAQPGPPPTPVPQTPVETWIMQGYAIGPDAGNEDSVGELMANVIRLAGGRYRMFYNRSLPGADSIKYAESEDAIHWTVKGLVLAGSADPTSRTHVLGGPSVVLLPDGRYRLYYRTAPAPQPGSPPQYHIRSAISQDGVTFT